MSRAIGIIKFILSNFGPIAVFYLLNHFYGLKVAIVFSVAWAVGDLARHRIRKKPVGRFLKFSCTLVILFGAVDLYLQQSVLFRYEAAISNLLVAFFFLSSLFGEKPLLREFAEAQGRIGAEISPDNEYYFRFLTVVWALYSFAKAILYAWIASTRTLGESLMFRMVIGNITFYGLLAISIFGSKPIKYLLAKMRLLPSSRLARTVLPALAE